MSRLHRAALLLLPASFRAEYGAEMRADHERARREAGSFAGRMAVEAAGLADVLGTAAAVHADVLRQDVRVAGRSLRRTPGFAVVAVLVSALGIGATTATFSVFDRVLVRPLPFATPDRLVRIWQDQSHRGFPQLELSPANYRDWKASAQSFDGMGAWRTSSVNLLGTGDPVRVDGAALTADVLPLLGVRPLLGRWLEAADDREGAPAVVLLGHAFWTSRFGADPGVVGRRVVLDGESHEIVGVMPPQFLFPSRQAALWTAMRFRAGAFEDRTDTHLHALARLREGVTLAEARAEMKVVASRVAALNPDDARTGATVRAFDDQVPSRTRIVVGGLFGAAALVLLIACSNLGTLLLSRALERRREMAVRTALGAGRERLARQLVTEAAVVAGLGGVLGCLAAAAAEPLAARLIPETLPLAAAAPVDLRVLLFAGLVTTVTALAFGLVPTLGLRSAPLAAWMRDGGRGTVRGSSRLRSTLVAAQVAASVVLLVTAGLLARALWRVEAVDPGFRADGVLTARTALPWPEYAATAARARFYRAVLDDVRTLPGVTHAGYISFAPMTMRGGVWPVSPGSAEPAADESRVASLRFVTPGVFGALDTPIVAGRDVAETDTEQSPFVAVVSESAARALWPGADPLGRRFTVAFREREVVGVVRDITVRGLDRVSEPQVYLPYRQVPDGALPFYAPKDLLVRATVEPASLVPAVREIVGRADARQPVSDVRTLRELVRGDVAPRAAQARALLGFAAVALLLAGLGIQGLLLQAVGARVAEIGVRRALGAGVGDVLALVARAGMQPALAGLVVGAGLSLAAGRTLEAMLFGVSPSDAATLAGALGLCLAAALAGSCWPAWRAVRVDPLQALRADAG